jgi:hypothetical protein
LYCLLSSVFFFWSLYYLIANKVAMWLDKKLSQFMDCPLNLPTQNTHIIMTTNLAHTQI